MDDAEPYDTQQKGNLETQTREIGYKRGKWFHKGDQVARSRWLQNSKHPIFFWTLTTSRYFCRFSQQVAFFNVLVPHVYFPGRREWHAAPHQRREGWTASYRGETWWCSTLGIWRKMGRQLPHVFLGWTFTNLSYSWCEPKGTRTTDFDPWFISGEVVSACPVQASRRASRPDQSSLFFRTFFLIGIWWYEGVKSNKTLEDIGSH